MTPAVGERYLLEEFNCNQAQLVHDYHLYAHQSFVSLQIISTFRLLSSSILQGSLEPMCEVIAAKWVCLVF